MSQWEIKALEANFDGFRQDHYPSLKVSEAFERFVVRQVLKDEDLSSDEVESGIVGGGDDGGIDGMYFFVNRSLIQNDADLPDDALTSHLLIVQAKYTEGFAETPVQKLESFAQDLFDHTRAVDGMVHLSPDVRDAIRRFRDNLTKLLASKHTMAVTFVYATKSDVGKRQPMHALSF